MSDSPAVILYDENGKVLAITDAAAIPSGTKVLLVAGKDASGRAQALPVGADGRLQVALSAPVAPAGATSVDQVAISSVAAGTLAAPTVVETAFTISSGKTLRLNRFQAGAEGSSNGSKVALFHQPSGNTTGEVLITVLFNNGSSNQQDLRKSYTGDGIARIVMRRYNNNTIACEVFGRWEGHEE